MAPIRVGIIGLRPRLSDDAGYWNQTGYWASLSHLPALQALPEQYEIYAVCNSSVESAAIAIKQYGLPDSTKAYGSVEDLANDPDVDLVIISVNVGKHLQLGKPALEKKKNVFMEWPLGAGLAESEELAKLASAAGVRTSVGVQARADPLVRKVKSIVESGQIGKVIASSVSISHSVIPFNTWMAGAEYFVTQKSGGNLFFIVFGHFLDSFTHVLGDFADVQSVVKRNWDSVSLYNAKDELVETNYPKTTPDQVFVQGTLESGAVVSIAARQSMAPVDGISYRWVIAGTEGEIEIVVPFNQWQFSESKRTIRLKIGRDEAQNVDFLSDDKHEGKVSAAAINVLRQYDAYARDDTDAFASFESALKTHRLLDRILQAAGWESF